VPGQQDFPVQSARVTVRVVDPDTVLFYRVQLRPHTSQSEFDLTGLDSLPRVEIVSDYAGLDSSAIGDCVERSPRGLVVSTFAGGRMSAGAQRGVSTAVDAGIPVVIASRVPGGRIVGNPAEQFGAVVARDLPAHKARILLMLALTKTQGVVGLQRIFDLY
jgi:L-asparaginase